ncbi:MAG: CoA pyrophosphatase [Anaerolineales bacterium]|nr:CoA pyrophosphatase [Anaerolineales bacterium]
MVRLEQVEAALRLAGFDTQHAHAQMAPMPRAMKRPLTLPGKPRVGGVLALLYDCHDQINVVLTRRRDDLNAHAGQISFPGGRNEPPEPLLTTALRETYEEVGIAPDVVQVLGALTPIYIPPSDYEVHPFVAWYTNGRCPTFLPAPREVAEILEVPLTHLLDPAIRQHEAREIMGHRLNVPFFAVAEHKVWGATAVMLSELVERLRVVMGETAVNAPLSPLA